MVYSYSELLRQGRSNASSFENMLKRKFQEEGDKEVALELVQSEMGIEMADKLSIDYINQSIKNLESIRV